MAININNFTTELIRKINSIINSSGIVPSGSVPVIESKYLYELNDDELPIPRVIVNMKSINDTSYRYNKAEQVVDQAGVITFNNSEIRISSVVYHVTFITDHTDSTSESIMEAIRDRFNFRVFPVFEDKVVKEVSNVIDMSFVDQRDFSIKRLSIQVDMDNKYVMSTSDYAETFDTTITLIEN